MKINPIELDGTWEEGFALDVHTVKSDYLGEDEFGHARFDTIRSDVGELLYRLKYNSDHSVVKLLALTAAQFVQARKWPIDLVVPVPASEAGRQLQPVAVLAESLAKNLGIPWCSDCVVKIKDTPALKSVYDHEERAKLLKDAHAVSAPDIEKKSVLILDDLYRSGATLQAVAESMKTNGKARALYVLAFTKTRSKR